MYTRFMPKTSAQLDREIDEALTLPTTEAPALTRKPRKTKRQREQEAAEAAEKRRSWLVMFQVPGSSWVYVAKTGSGGTLDPDGAFDFGSRDAAESRATAMQGPRSSLRAKVTSRLKV